MTNTIYRGKYQCFEFFFPVIMICFSQIMKNLLFDYLNHFMPLVLSIPLENIRNPELSGGIKGDQ